MDVGYILRRVSKDYCNISPDQVAVQLEDGPRWTYRELDEISSRYANAFANKGVKKGDRIGVLLYNCLEYFGIYFAAAKVGAIVVRINFRLVSEELNYIINDSGAKILCFGSAFAERIQPIRESLPVESYICLGDYDIPTPDWCEPWDVLDREDTKFHYSEHVDAPDPLMLMYTSGTTGRPKGAIWTHSNTYWYATQQIMKWGLKPDHTTITPGPMYHVGALELLSMPALLLGGKAIISKSGGFNTSHYLRVIEQEKVNFAEFFTFMLYEMADIVDSEQLALPDLKSIIFGGESLYPWVYEKLQSQLPHLELRQIYGLTEGSPTVSSLDPEDIVTKRHTVGKPLPLVELKITDDTGAELKRGETGEIWTRNPVVAKEYWNMPKETTDTFVNGWCKTGDLGKIDEDGYLMITGRKKDMIRSGGENIYPAELEDLLSRHPSIKEVAVIGVPDPKYIETVCAVVVPHENVELSSEEVTKYCEERMARYKIPKYVEFAEVLPRTPSGKVTKYKLREIYQHLGKVREF